MSWFPTLPLLLLTAGGEASFTLVGETDGVRLEARHPDGSSFEELRATRSTSLSLRALCDAAWGDGTVKPGDPFLRERKVLEERDNERVTWERAAAPVVSDRDYVLRQRRTEGASWCEVAYEAVTDRGPPAQAGLVRLTRLRAKWRFEVRDGRTQVQLLTYSEPGGGVPAFLSAGAQRSSAVRLVGWIVELAGR